MEGRPLKKPHAGRKASYSARKLHTAERKVLRLQETLRKSEERTRRNEEKIHLLGGNYLPALFSRTILAICIRKDMWKVLRCTFRRQVEMVSCLGERRSRLPLNYWSQQQLVLGHGDGKKRSEVPRSLPLTCSRTGTGGHSL